jgi:predicted O-linked N-acetylglucosamine transferase (SPINDLY family)/glycosyltransferase involved in cell wall biosynthesis
MRIAFVDPINWDYRIETPHQHPLGGSQSALCYLAEELVRQGHEIFLLNNASLAGLSRGVVCLPLSLQSIALFQSLHLDAVIILNGVSIGKQLKPLLPQKTRLICWIQSAHDQPNVSLFHQITEREVYDGVALVSQWQQTQFQKQFGLKPERVHVLRNAIAPCFNNLFTQSDTILAAKSDPPTLAYTSTPFRGLELLLDLFPHIQTAIPDVRLQVFSSLQVYQQDSTHDEFRGLYDRCRTMSGVEYIGSLPQPELAQTLQSVTVLAYPNIFLETSCIAAMEALASGCQIITSDLGALPETTAGFAHLIPVTGAAEAVRVINLTGDARQEYIHQFVTATIAALQASRDRSSTLETKLHQQIAYANQNYTWSGRAREWLAWLDHLRLQDRVNLSPSVSAISSSQPTSAPAIAPPPSTLPDWKCIELLDQAAQLGQAGRFAEVRTVCETILQQDPQQARAWHLLGLACFQSGDSSTALAHLERAIALNPDEASFQNHLGVVYYSLGQFERGLACYQQAYQLQPQSVDIQYNLALALQKQGNLEAALAHYQQIVARQSDHLQAHLNLGNIWQQQQQFEQAIAHYHHALNLRPAHAETWLRLATARQGQGELAEAMRCYQQALAFSPDSLEAHNNLGTVFHQMGQAQQAIAHYQQALALQPDFPHALLNLGNTLLKLERFAEAEATYRQLLQRDPDDLRALDGLVKLMRQQCQWAEVEAFSDRLMAVAQQQLERGLPCPVMPLNTLILPFSAAQQQAIARDNAQTVARHMAERRRQLDFETKQRQRLAQVTSSQPRLRVGYVSGDFRDHAVGHLILQLFRLHDRQQFEVYAYSVGPDDESHYRQTFIQTCDRFVDISALSPTASAIQLFNDAIDLLIDLAGYTEYGCPELFALRPAPIQINYLGYPGTLGAEFIDYILTDTTITPSDQATFFTERCVYLPHCYQINDNQQIIDPKPDRASVGLPNRGFVYCCFNNTRKIDPGLFSSWMRILIQVPDSVLWLYRSYSEVEHNLKREAEARGVAGDRLIFADHLPKREHLTRLQCADLVLDTRFYNAHTTASDALWAGVPLVTILGTTFASRVAASLLRAIGLPELMTTNLADYERLATHLAHAPQELHQLQTKLASQRQTSPLYDTEGSVRSLEQIYQQLWQHYRSIF